VLASTITALSVLLDNPSGATATHARMILLALLPLVEDSGSASLLAAPLERAEFQIFSRDKQVDPVTGLKEAGAGLAPLRVLSDLLVLFLSSNMRLALEVDLYHAALRVLHRVLSFHKSVGLVNGTLSVSVPALAGVCLRLITYLSRDAVWTALGAERAGGLALAASGMLSLLLVHGLTMLPEEHGYASLCYEVARVCANKVFRKMLVLVKEPSEGTTLDRLRLEVELLQSTGEVINAGVQEWLDGLPQGQAYTEKDVMTVVATALLQLSLPVREDLVVYDNMSDSDPEQRLLASAMLANLVSLYSTHIHVLPALSAQPP